MNDDETPILPSHIEHGVRAAAELGAEHHRESTLYQRAIDRITAALGEPRFVGIVCAVVLVWVVDNLAGPRSLRFDPPPFGWLATVASVAALFMTILILTTQRRADRLDGERAQLILQLALVNEQKNSKVIELLERLRSDHPEIEDRTDDEASAMKKSAHPAEVLSTLKAANRNLGR